ncbi:MAG: HXXEE domain-containing protein [Flavobacteriaceae bacterium]|nr:HXXEE domain-containing protein [Bacteroidia bacterium]NNK70252.1 HXXEE domain-containing protein [Flavobacteriaceae bacterium]
MVFKYSKVIASAIALISIFTLYLVSAEISSVLVFIPGVLVSLIVYLFTFEKNIPKPKRILPLYLFALGMQFLHFTEEYLTGFHIKLPALFNQPPYDLDVWTTFNMVAYFIFILGGIALFKNLKEFTIIVIFFILFGIMFNGIVHVLTSLYIGDYFPGLYTALTYLVIGPILIKRCFITVS